MPRFLPALTLLLIGSLPASPLSAQDDFAPQKPKKVNGLFGDDNGGFQPLLPNDKAPNPLGEPVGVEPKMEITLYPAGGKTPEQLQPGDLVVLQFSATFGPDSYTYPVASGPAGTKIKIKTLTGLKPVDQEFLADQQPKQDVDAFGDPITKIVKPVNWFRRYTLEPGASPEKVILAGDLSWQVCNASTCTPLDQAFEVKLAAPPATLVALPPLPVLSTHPFTYTERPVLQPGKMASPGEVTVKLSPEQAKPGDTVTLELTIALENGWHVYTMNQNPKHTGLPTVAKLSVFGLEEKAKGYIHQAHPETKPGEKGAMEFYHDRAVWVKEFTVKPEATAYGVQGSVQYQTCDAKKCLMPLTVNFGLGQFDPQALADLGSGGSLPDPSLPVRSTAFNLDELASNLQPEEQSSNLGLGVVLISAFFGGLFLNVMPCVLPVIAIKLLSFVKQAGQSRSRAIALNLSYTGGILAVFTVLAGLASFAGLAWGEQMGSTGFNLVMVSVVFVMALSLLGVFEIPIPGLGGSGAGADKEGLPGAFLTGCFATILSVPCSGPLLGPVFGWSLKQPPEMIFGVWLLMGLGMAMPYLLIGFFPALIKWLPQPGMWMLRFKQIAGFALLGTVIFFLYFTDSSYTIGILIMLLGYGIATWMYGLHQHKMPSERSLALPVSALLTALLLGAGGYLLGRDTDAADTRVAAETARKLEQAEQVLAGNGQALTPETTAEVADTSELDWQNFTEPKLASLLAEQKTVMIDFTADWCVSCKALERAVLNTRPTREFVDKHQIVALKADFTNRDSEQGKVIKKWLERLNSNSIPILVIFPANAPDKPIVLRDAYTRTTLLEKLGEAVGNPAHQQASAKTAQTTPAGN